MESRKDLVSFHCPNFTEHLGASTVSDSQASLASGMHLSSDCSSLCILPQQFTGFSLPLLHKAFLPGDSILRRRKPIPSIFHPRTPRPSASIRPETRFNLYCPCKGILNSKREAAQRWLTWPCHKPGPCRESEKLSDSQASLSHLSSNMVSKLGKSPD